MKNPTGLNITVRGLIVHDHRLFVVKHAPNSPYFALPGGGLEDGEHLDAAMARELKEELNIDAEVGRCLIINDWIGATSHYVEFFFWIRNAADFLRADTKSASHGTELSQFGFEDPAKIHLLPRYLKDAFPQIDQLGEDFPTAVMQSITEPDSTFKN